MANFKNIEAAVTASLGLTRRPVAIRFHSGEPGDFQKFEGGVPSGCSFWSLAASGRSFYTVPSDHYNCPIGSYTHRIEVPEARQPELMQTLGFMTEIGYLKMEEVPGIPRLEQAPGAVSYCPLGEATSEPDAVILTGKPAAMMLWIETATRAGVAYQMPTLARPTCMAIPAAMNGGLVTSTGCIGNRTYTGIGDEELYAVVRGSDLEKVAEALGTIVSANAKLKEYHEARKRELTA